MMRNRFYRVLVSLGLVAVLAGTSGAIAGAEALTEEAAEASTEGSLDQIASAEDMTTVDDVVEDWMVPITADELVDGVYEVEVLSSSSMFKIVSATLAVSGGKMSAVLTMSGTGYLYVFPGTPEEAVAAEEEDYISYQENSEGAHTYTIPVEALDAPVKCAAFSKNKEKWYDRTLVFLSSSLPLDAFRELKLTSVEDLGLEDGTYSAQATLTGGSGKASIESPAQVIVADGEASLVVVFSSKNYDYMLVGEEKYLNENEGGNSTFTIPIPGFDFAIPVTADTTAMSKPHEIDYTIRLDSATIAAQ